MLHVVQRRTEANIMALAFRQTHILSEVIRFGPSLKQRTAIIEDRVSETNKEAQTALSRYRLLYIRKALLITESTMAYLSD